MQRSDGMNYAPTGKSEPVVEKGEFIFAASHLDHGHINGQTNGLLEAGGVCKYVYDSDRSRVEAFCETYPGVKPVDSFEEILEDDSVHLVTSAAIPCYRSSIGIQVLESGKDYFTDKSPFTTLDQLAEVRAKVSETNRKYMCYFSERLHVEGAWYAGELIKQGAIGRVLQVLTMAPHRLAKANRPNWFFEKDKYGGILTDIGSHQFEQFLAYSDATDATVNFARVENFANPDKPGLEDFGEASLTTDNGVSCYSRIDWFNPDGLRVWGDGRTFVLGTNGTIEIRKYVDVARENPGDRVFIVDGKREQEIPCHGAVGFPFFGQLILDVLNRTEEAMTQEHVFKSAEIAMLAQKYADEGRKSTVES